MSTDDWLRSALTSSAGERGLASTSSSPADEDPDAWLRRVARSSKDVTKR